MKCRIKAESKGRIRIHAEVSRMSLQEADVLEYYLRNVSGVSRVKVFDRTCDAVIRYSGNRSDVTRALACFSFDDEAAKALVPEHTSRESDRYYQDRLVNYVLRRYAKRFFLPHNIRLAITALHAIKYVKEGIKVLMNGDLNVAVLDATAITTSILRNDHDTASSVMFLLGVGEILEEWVRRKSISDLAGMMSLKVDKVWACTEEGEVLVPVSDVSAGDVIIVRTGNLIPLDGKVASGEIFEDEGVEVAEEDKSAFGSLPSEYSLLYLSLEGKLAAVICISDPPRENAADVIRKLREAGFSNIVMMTGDSERSAKHTAEMTGIDNYVAGVLPEDKAEFIRMQRQSGHKVVMIGDGINDSPALSEADVGIAVNSGAAIARDIADITIEADDLETLLTLRRIAVALMDRIHRDYRVIIAFNSLLIALGASGRISPQTSALLHNISTLVIGMYNMTDLLEDPANKMEDPNEQS